MALEGRIVRHQETLDRLQAEGHSCPDAERELKRMKESLALLK
jgi:hypothetical protein